MGYRSEVVIFIGCHTEEQAVEFGQLCPRPDDIGIWAEIMQEFKREGRYWVYKDDSIKWYPDFSFVQAMRAIIDFAKTAWDEHELDTCGAFARVGEEQSDIEYEVWEFENFMNESSPYDAVNVYTTIEVNLDTFDKPIASNNG